MIGSVISHYRIVSKLGAGGMGVVYRARDERLDRDVAIKVLPEALAQDPERLARFEREAKAVARLAHPNILEIHELGEHEGRPFMITEVLEGETLRDRMRGGRLGWRRAAEIGAAIADGLAAAHRAGVVHRDLKPSNVFLTSDGRVKVLDFGLARVDEEVDHEADTVTHSPGETRAGTVLGTVGYMSPEQVKGHPVDHRSDIFSLGCVLYEMVSGGRAFERDTAVETMNAILKEEPREISTADEAIPPELIGAIDRCLEKRPDARFQSASDLAYNLRTISGVRTPTGEVAAPSTSQRRRRWLGIAAAAAVVIAGVIGLAVWAPWKTSPEQAIQATESEAAEETQWVAVAPLQNRTGDPTLDILGQRAVDVIVQRFAEAGQSSGVLTMDSVPYPSPGKGAAGMRMQGDGGPTGSVGPKGPHTLLSGTYYLAGDELELQARLTDYDTGELVYVFEPVKCSKSGSPAALDDLAEHVAAAMRMHWHVRQDLRIMTPASSIEALNAAGTGSSHYWSGEYEEALAAYEYALELEPRYLSAWDGKVRTLQKMGRHDEVERQLATADERFHDLTPFEKAWLAWERAAVRGNLPGELAATRRMAQIAPHLNWLQYNLALLTIQLNRPGEALEVAARNPEFFRGTWGLILLQAHHMLSQYEEQRNGARRGRETRPERGDFYFHEAAALAALGRPEEVDAVIDNCLSVQLEEAPHKMNMGEVMKNVALELRAHGDRERSDELARRAVEWYERRAAGLGLPNRDIMDLFQHSHALRIAGRWREAGEFLTELDQRGRFPVSVTGLLGVVAARTGDHDEARRIFDQLAVVDDREIPGAASYNRACIAAQLGDKDRAVELLRQANAEGHAYSWDTHCDIDLEPLWDYLPFQELIAPKG